MKKLIIKDRNGKKRVSTGFIVNNRTVKDEKIKSILAVKKEFKNIPYAFLDPFLCEEVGMIVSHKENAEVFVFDLKIKNLLDIIWNSCKIKENDYSFEGTIMEIKTEINYDGIKYILNIQGKEQLIYLYYKK